MPKVYLIGKIKHITIKVNNLEEIKENINISDEELKSLLNKLVEDGEIYQDRPNNYRII